MHEKRKRNILDLNRYSLLLLLCLLSGWGSSLCAQSNPSNLRISEVFQDQPLPEVLQFLKDKYELNFAYDHQAIAGEKVTCTLQDLELSTALEQLFANSDLIYQQVGDGKILIRKHVVKNDKEVEFLSLRGQIIDQETGLPLAYAAVYLPDQKVGTVTDEQGNFMLQCKQPTVDQQLRIQYLGYESRDIDLASISNDQLPPIALKMAAQEIPDITIVEELPILSVSQLDGGTKLRFEKLASLPDFAAGQDIFRNLQLLPGVSATDDLSAGLKVRGSDGDENMVLLDGITLYNINHFFGVFSLLNPDVVHEATFYKNAFPVEYGGRNASVVDISTKPFETAFKSTKADRFNGGATFNILTSQAYLQFPLGKKMGLLIGGRTTNFDVAKTQLFDSARDQNPLAGNNQEDSLRFRDAVISEKPSFKFYDFNVKWNWQITPRTSVQVAHFQGYDDYTYDYTESYNYLLTRDVRQRRKETYLESAAWKNSGQSLQLQHQWAPSFKTELSFSQSVYENKDDLLVSLEVVRRRLPDTTILAINNIIDNRIEGRELNLKNSWEMNEQRELIFGYHLVDSEVKTVLGINNRRVINDQAQGQQHAGYLQWKESMLGEHLHLSLGLRGIWYTPTESLFFSPRIRVDIQATNDLLFKGAFSRYHQFLRQAYHENRFGQTFDFWIMANTNSTDQLRGRDIFPVSSSTHYMAGFTYRKNNFLLDMEFYRKDNEGVIEHGPSVLSLTGNLNPLDNYFLFYGDGETIGVDVLLQKEINRYTSWLAYTLSKTTNRFGAIQNNQPFPSKDDRRHQLKWINQYKLNRWDFSLTYVFSSGRPYTDLSLINGDTDRNSNLINRLPDYHRVDLGLHYNFPIGNTQATLGASVFNLFDHSNVKYRQYIYDTPANTNTGAKREVVGTDVEMLGFTPNLSFSWKF